MLSHILARLSSEFRATPEKALAWMISVYGGPVEYLRAHGLHDYADMVAKELAETSA